VASFKEVDYQLHQPHSPASVHCHLSSTESYFLSTILTSFKPSMFKHSAHKILLMKATTKLLYLLIFSTVFFSCKNDKEEFQTEPLTDYIPLTEGKYIIYRVDSTVFPDFGRKTEVHVYQEKHIIDAKITDVLGRESYRVFRFLRDSAGKQPWASSGSYMITPTNAATEVIENNLRFIKLVSPLKLDGTWKGNRFLPDEPYDPLYDFNNDFDIADWDYTYTSMGETISLNNKTINDVITVDGIDDVVNVPVTDPANYGSINHQQEKYAKGIGMVFQELTMWEYQPNTGGSGGGFKVGFGVKRSMIDHN